MTHEERVHYHMYVTCEGIAEHAERIVALEELVADYINAACGACVAWSYPYINCPHNDGGKCMLVDRARKLGIEAKNDQA